MWRLINKKVVKKSQATLAKLPLRSRGRVRAEGAEFLVPSLTSELPGDHPAVLAELKRRIVAAQTRAAATVTRELMRHHRDVGAGHAQDGGLGGRSRSSEA